MPVSPPSTPLLNPGSVPSAQAPITTTPARRRAWVRENIEALAFAVVLALVLKYFALEAYEIPTSSMQPTLMGSRDAGIFDRILVDKLSYTFREPERFDIAVFRYPLNTSQNYVKRIWGMPEDILKIIDGNVYRRVTAETVNERAFEALRKPDHIQKGLWKLVYDSELTELGTRPIRPATDFERTTRDGSFEVDRDRRFVLRASAKTKGVATLGAGDRLRDHYWHGYPPAVQEALMRGREMPRDSGGEPVQDVRLSFRVRPSEGTASVFAQLRMEQEVGGPRIFRLEVDRTGVRLVAEMDRKPPENAFQTSSGIEPGREAQITFAHLDDQVIGIVDGREAGRFAYRPAVLGLKRDAPLELSFGAETSGETVFSHVRVERDLHLRASGIAENGKTVVIPPGHYWMLGDNTLASEDGRAWTQISFKVNEQGSILPPSDPSPHPVLRGNRRPVATSSPLDPDENPIISRLTQKVVFTDFLGEEHVFPWDGKEWGLELPRAAVLEPVSFVPREFIIGRALMVFWPLNPFGSFRLGFVK